MAGARAGGAFPKAAAAFALAVAAAGCAGSPTAVFDLTAARPPAQRPIGAQFRINEPIATLDLDSDRILVRNGMELELLPGVRWPQQLSSLFRNRLIESFQNAGLARSVDGGAASSNYGLDLDIRSFELDAASSQAHVEIAAKVVDLASGRVVDVAILSARKPVSSTTPASVVAALDDASNEVMAQIVRFVAKAL
jgi:cholesterol transport system auxiliary component